MNKKEFFAAVNLYKRQSEIVQWKNDFLPKAIAASAKEILAHSTGNDEDAMAFANELASYTKKLDWLPDSEFAKISSLIEHSAEEMAEKYGATFDDGVLEHGTKWKNHKYIRIENGRYIYEDQTDRDKRDADISRNEKIASTARSYSKGMNDKANEREKIANEVEVIGEHTKAFKDVNLDIAKAERQKANKMSEDARNYQRTANELKKIQNQPIIRDDDLKDQERQRNESVAKAQREGEAMQAWKNRKEAVKSGSGESYEKAQKEGEAQQAWKNVQAQKETLKNQTGSNNAKNQAQAEGEAQQRWRNAQEATKRMEEDKARTIDWVTDVESGIRKETFDDELRIRKQALADANVDQKRIDEAKARKAEAIRAKDDNSKNQAQREGEAMQAWKNQQAVRAKDNGSKNAAQAEGEAQQKWKDGHWETKSLYYESMNGTRHNSGHTYKEFVTQNKKVNDAYSSYNDSYKDLGSEEAFIKVSKDLSREEGINLLKKILPLDVTDGYYERWYDETMEKHKSAKHSFDLSTKEGYYAAIAEYKKKA